MGQNESDGHKSHNNSSGMKNIETCEEGPWSLWKILNNKLEFHQF